MTIDEHNAIITQLRTVDNDADRITLLTQLSTDYGQTLGQVELATADKIKAEEQASKFAILNNQYFLESTKQLETINQHNNQSVELEKKEIPIKKSYADLEAQMFNERMGGKK